MFKFLADIFDSQASSSFGRMATAVTVLTGCGCLIFLVIKNHGLPESTQLIALSAFMTAPYAITKTAAAFTRPGPAAQPDNPTGTLNLQAAADVDKRKRLARLAGLVLIGLILCSCLYSALLRSR